MKAAKLVISIVIILLLQACVQTAPPKTTAISGKEFKIIVPKGLERTESQAWGINFMPFRNVIRRNSKGSIEEFYSVGYELASSTNQLVTKACKGDYFISTRSVYQSCIEYKIGHKVVDKGESLEITLTPKQKTTTPGKNLVFIPMPLPKVNETSLPGWLSSQRVQLRGQIISDFPSESIKGNFDRLLENYSWGAKADAAHRQFRDSYAIKMNKDITVVISAGFYPYKNGSMIEYIIEGRSENNPDVNERNWKAILEKVIQRLESVAQS